MPEQIRINSGFVLGTLLLDCPPNPSSSFLYSDVPHACEDYLWKNVPYYRGKEDWNGAFFARFNILHPKPCKGSINLGNIRKESDGDYYYHKLKMLDDSDLLKRFDYMGRRLEEDLENILKLQNAGHLRITGFYTGEKLPNH